MPCGTDLICRVRSHSRTNGDRTEGAGLGGAGWHQSDLSCTVVLPEKRETALGCRCRSTERRSVLYGCTPAKRESVLDCKCRGTHQQICNCTVALPPKGRPYWAVGAGAPSHGSAVYGNTPARRETALGYRCRSTERRSALESPCWTASAGALVGRSATVRLHSRQKGDRTGLWVPGHRAADLRCTVTLPPKRRDRTQRVPGHRAVCLHCTVTLPPKGRPHQAVGAGAPSADLHCTVALPPKGRPYCMTATLLVDTATLALAPMGFMHCVTGTAVGHCDCDRFKIAK